jgi:hypothetical protein
MRLLFQRRELSVPRAIEAVSKRSATTPVPRVTYQSVFALAAAAITE